jgi:transposase
MGLSRRTFTREFKLEAVRRLEMGVPVAELARALEVNPNVLHRWRREPHQGRAIRFRGRGDGVGRRDGLRSWKVRWGDRR